MRLILPSPLQKTTGSTTMLLMLMAEEKRATTVPIRSAFSLRLLVGVLFQLWEKMVKTRAIMLGKIRVKKTELMLLLLMLMLLLLLPIIVAKT